MDIYSLTQDIPEWRDFFTQEDVIYEIKKLSKKLNISNPIPSMNNLFNPFKHVTPDRVRVCILFDRPPNMYNEFNKDVPVSNGMGCGLEEDVTDMTYKIGNIYNELIRTFSDFDVPQCHTFTGWDRVLVLNCMMLVEAGSENNSSLWLSFINTIIKYIEFRSVIFILCCGDYYEKKITGMIKKSRIITAPSPMYKSFIGSGVFRQCNAALKDMHKKSINWCKINK